MRVSPGERAKLFAAGFVPDGNGGMKKEDDLAPSDGAWKRVDGGAMVRDADDGYRVRPPEPPADRRPANEQAELRAAMLAPIVNKSGDDARKIVAAHLAHPERAQRQAGIQQARAVADGELQRSQERVSEFVRVAHEKHATALADAERMAAAAERRENEALAAQFREVDKALVDFPDAPRRTAVRVIEILRPLLEAIDVRLVGAASPARLAASFCVVAGRIDVAGQEDFIMGGTDVSLVAIAQNVYNAIRKGAGPAEVQAGLLELEVAVERAIATSQYGNEARGRVVLEQMTTRGLSLALAAT